MGNKRRRNPTPRRPAERSAPKRPLLDPRFVLALGALAVAGVMVLWLVSSRGSDGSPAAGAHDHAAGAPLNVTATGIASAAGVEVSEASVDFGHVPLNVPVDRTFVLRNTGSERVTLGKTRIEVVEGCCPPDPVPGATAIEPGGQSNYVFSLPMGMHEGMGGKHLFRITIPVKAASTSGDLQLLVAGDFG